MSTYGGRLFPQHAALLEASTIPPELARARGYVTVDTKVRLEQLGVTRAGRNVPGLLVPLLRKDGSTWGYQYRPDEPRRNDKGKPVKYETPARQRAGLDVPPGVGPLLDDPRVTLWVTEGSRKADAAAVLGLACVSIPGVWSWRGTNAVGGKVALDEWHDVALNGRRVILAFDSDVAVKPSVAKALRALAGYLETKGAAKVEHLHLPHDADKAGLDDYLAAGHGVDDLLALVRPEPPVTAPPTEEQTTPETEVPTAPPPVPITLDRAHAVFRRWLGDEYDLLALDAVLAAAAVEQLDGDPVWLLIVSGSGNAKTETVAALAGAGAFVTSTVTSEGALLSATANKERGRNATGGLLRKIGDRGLLVIKDVTSILSMGREVRAGVLAALREVYDGKWERNVGTDGGRSLTWTGRLVVIGAVTTAYDSAHGVIASMGDRFALVRVDSNLGRVVSGRRALRNVGQEVEMRAELADAAGAVLAQLHTERAELADDALEQLLAAADLVTLARTGVERDGRGDVVDAHAPEMPTRFAKMLGQIVRGGLALGMDPEHALVVALRVAGDSVPPLRLAVLTDLQANPGARTSEVTRRLQRPRSTIDRTLQELHVLGLAVVDETVAGQGWHYRLSGLVDEQTLHALVTRKVSTGVLGVREGTPASEVHPPTDVSGYTPAGGPASATAPTCPSCRWPVDSNGHAANCGATQ